MLLTDDKENRRKAVEEGKLEAYSGLKPYFFFFCMVIIINSD